MSRDCVIYKLLIGKTVLRQCLAIFFNFLQTSAQEFLQLFLINHLSMYLVACLQVENRKYATTLKQGHLRTLFSSSFLRTQLFKTRRIQLNILYRKGDV